MAAYRIFEGNVAGGLVHLRMDMLSAEWVVRCLDPETGNPAFSETVYENDEDVALLDLIKKLEKRGLRVHNIRLIASENS